MDDEYMPTWNECYAKINELYKENLDLRAKVSKHTIESKQAQDMIDELEMLRVAQNSIIKALNEALSDRQEFIDKQQEMIDRLELKRVSNLHLIKEQGDRINVLTKDLKDKTEKLNDLTIINQTQRSIIFDQKDVIGEYYNILNFIWLNRNTILGIPKEIRETISELINPHSA